MPKLLLFAPCEKVIIDKDHNTTSLIVLLEAINLPIPQGEEAKVPAEANLAFSWHVISLWQAQKEDEAKHWEQKVTIEVPSGEDTRLPPAILPLQFEAGKPNYRNVINILGFPLNPFLTTDICNLKLFLREIGKGEDWQVVADFPLLIRRIATPKDAE